MKFPLMSNEEVRKSDRGDVVITEGDVRSMPEDQIFDALSKEYTRMVQENPEHTFSILRDGLKGTITISWTRRI
jgi:hypothetical protein